MLLSKPIQDEVAAKENETEKEKQVEETSPKLAEIQPKVLSVYAYKNFRKTELKRATLKLGTSRKKVLDIAKRVNFTQVNFSTLSLFLLPKYLVL